MQQTSNKNNHFNPQVPDRAIRLMKNCESVKEMKARIRLLNAKIKQFNENEIEKDLVINNTLFDDLQTKNRLLCYDMLTHSLRIVEQIAHMYNSNNIGSDNFMTAKIDFEVEHIADLYKELSK